MTREREGSSAFGRGRRVARSGTCADLGASAKRLCADPRFRGLSNRAGRVLLVCFISFADRDGHWWTSHARAAQEIAMSPKTVQRGVAEAASEEIASLVDPQRPLLTIRPWLRPPGAKGGPLQTSNMYELDPQVVRPTRGDHPDEAPIGRDNPGQANKGGQACPGGQAGTTLSAERGLNEYKNDCPAAPSNGAPPYLYLVKACDIDDTDPGSRLVIGGSNDLNDAKAQAAAFERVWGKPASVWPREDVTEAA
jgi:hypothetical protein